jgi:predicted pyridoxine 5'-phosphate oxidase superfamily flavin-nucleotide-binding protein
MKSFASLAFTADVKAIQEKYGSRQNCERLEERSHEEGLSDFEINFIKSRDSFYMATIGTNGFPYIQHRGGPKGFVKVINANTIGFVDFSGNRQYISTGNLSAHDKVALILMDYSARSRLKIYAKAELIEVAGHENLLKTLTPIDYTFKPERMVLLHIEAFDWNCPQHIAQRFTIEEFEEALAPQREYIRQLERELEELKGK